jgi:hypothetical protein
MNMKTFKPGSEHADPVVPGLRYLVGMDKVISLIYRYTDGEHDYSEFLGILDDMSLQSARNHARRLSVGVCPV